MMGAWGTGSFDNDDAADLLSDVTEGADLDPVLAILGIASGADEYLEAPDASQAVAAAEIVTAALGRPTGAARQQDELTDWIARVKPVVDVALVQLAVKALDRILAPDSELRELWQEADEFNEWEATVIALRSQLQL